MSSWIVEALNAERRDQSQTEVSRRLLNKALFETSNMQNADLQFMADSMELAVIDLLENETQPYEERLKAVRKISTDAFQLLRVIPLPEAPIESAKICLRMACLAVLGERGADAARLLKETPWPILPLESSSWGERTLATVLDVWLRLIRKDGWGDLDEVQVEIIGLREQQRNLERIYLESQETIARTAAWQLVILYHLAKAAELLAIFTTQGQVDRHFDIREQLEAQFDRALNACSRAELMELDTFTRLLSHTARQLVDNCIWTVTRAVNGRVSQFVENLVSRNRPKPIFEMLPPQRRALRDAGLLGSGHRAVVVNLPTSSGKTLIAEFRILQALNQFEREKGWIAYLVPTRALVNQICTRLRRDFAPLNINVERVSPALEVDALEASLLTDRDSSTLFRVLVTTPEKLDLMLRGGWEEKIGRHLTLVVVDEAHNLAQKERGIKLELLLATINRDCRYAQFLLLTPFIDNAKEIARWLSPDSYNNIELGLDWQPNDRAIVLSIPCRGTSRGEFSIDLETIHTTKNTLTVPERLPLPSEENLGLCWSAVNKNASKLAAATAQRLKSRGPVIVLASRPDWVWSLASNLKHPINRQHATENVQLVKSYLAQEFGSGFELCELLDYGVGVHHAGLSDEAKALMEWLLENKQIQVLIATTTIAQGVNFPVSSVILAQNKYYDEAEGMIEMPPEDFWNLAGRTGRIEQGSVGIIALAATDNNKAIELRNFVRREVLSLNSTLIHMVQEVMNVGGQLQLHLLFHKPEWSAFLQYLAHTYRQIGDPSQFANQIEQVMRGTLGFQNLRRTNTEWANSLIVGVRAYGERIAGKPLGLVDSTGFSWESVNATLSRLAEERITRDVWDPDQLFRTDNRNLQKLMGILLSVPELRENLTVATGGRGPDGDLLARIVRSWVNGTSLPEMANEYFSIDRDGNSVEPTKALTDCCKNVFGRLAQTASWGLAALQTINIGDAFDNLPENEQQTLRNLPARVFYGVNTNEAIALRLLGVPRGAAQPLALTLGDSLQRVALSQVRNLLSQADVRIWAQAMGERGHVYFKVWKILEGLV
jgi:hypothetical protein